MSYLCKCKPKTLYSVLLETLKCIFLFCSLNVVLFNEETFSGLCCITVDMKRHVKAN